MANSAFTVIGLSTQGGAERMPWLKNHVGIDVNKLGMYDRVEYVTDQAASAEPSVAYPDWTEDNTFVKTGPIGGTKVRGEGFATMQEAERVLKARYGAPVERFFWPVDSADGSTGGRYGFRFRKASLT